MLITYLQDHFEFDEGFYYSPAFKAGKHNSTSGVDIYITASAELTSPGSVSIQSSIDKITWHDSKGTEFLCDISGLQQYKDAQYNLNYRLKSSVEFLSAKILV